MEQSNQRRRFYSDERNTSQTNDYYKRQNRGYGDNDNDDDYGNPESRNWNRGQSGRNFNRFNDENENDWNNRNEYGRRNRFNQDYGSGYGDYGRGYGSSQDYGRNFSRGGYSRDYDRDSDRGTYAQRGFSGYDYDDSRSQDYGRFNRSMDYGRNRNYEYGNRGGYDDDRGWWNRTKDEVSSWFGDDDARRRREQDEWRDTSFRGKGPKDYKRSRERIQEDINDRLSDAYDVDASEIEVKVEGSEVTLSGRVNTKREKRRAEDIAEDVSGVSNVQNNLRVSQQSSGTSWNDTSGISRSTGGNTSDISTTGSKSKA